MRRALIASAIVLAACAPTKGAEEIDPVSDHLIVVTTPAPTATTPIPTPTDDISVYYRSCAKVPDALKPLRIGDPGYRPGLDRDKDGVACDGQ